jgi:hypothetical protein
LRSQTTNPNPEPNPIARYDFPDRSSRVERFTERTLSDVGRQPEVGST